MIPMIGTIKSAVRQAELNSKWQQKKDSIGSKKFLQEKTPEQRQIDAFLEDLEKIHENDDYSQIYNKIKSGKRLSSKEAECLRKRDPQAYADYKVAEAEKEAFKKKLRNCKTKDEVRKLKVTQMGNYLATAKSVTNNPQIPKSKKIEILGRLMGRVNGIEEIYTEFVKTTEYTGLSDTVFDENEETKKKRPKTEESEIQEESVPGDISLEDTEEVLDCIKNMETDVKCSP